MLSVQKALVVLCLGLAPWLAQAREVRVGVYQNPPQLMVGPDGQPSGILGDLLREIARREGWILKPIACEWQDCLRAVQEGQIDLLPGVERSDSRALPFDFHQTPVVHSWSQLYQRSGEPLLNTMPDLKGKRVAVIENSPQHEYLARLLPAFGLDTQLVSVRSPQEAFERAREQAADAAVANRFFGDAQAARYQLVASSNMFLPTELFYVTGSGKNAELLAVIDLHLNRWQAQADSVYQQVLRRWVGGQPPSEIPVLYWRVGLTLLVLLALAVGGIVLLRRQVARRTGQLRASERKLSSILDGVGAYIFIKGLDGRYQYVNEQLAQLLGRSPQDAVGCRDADLFDPETAALLVRHDLRVLQQGERVQEEEIVRTIHDQKTHVCRSIKLPLRRPDGSIYALCGISTDIGASQQERQDQLQYAGHDPLTGLPNRHCLMERLQQVLAASARHPQRDALLMLDLDRFKALKSSRSENPGDQLLKSVAQRLRSCTREEDMLARAGASNFAVLLQSLGDTEAQASLQAERVTRRILAQLSKPYAVGTNEYQGEVNIGVAPCGQAHISREELLAQAQTALRRAKDEGASTLRFFDPQSTSTSQESGQQAVLRR